MRNHELAVCICLMICASAGMLYADGSLQIVSASEDISWDLSIDNQDIAYQSGMTIWLSAGVHRIIAQAEGYRRIDESISISDGSHQQRVLSAESVPLSDASETELFTAHQVNSTAVITGTVADQVCTVDGVPVILPAALQLREGTHEISSGAYSWDIEIRKGRVAGIQIDAKSGRLKQFSAESREFAALASQQQDLQRLFDLGMRSFGRRFELSVRVILIIAAAAVLVVLFLIWRLSIYGRVLHDRFSLWRIGRKVRHARKRGYAKEAEAALSRHSRRRRHLQQLQEQVQKHIEDSKRVYARHAGASDKVQLKKKRKAAKKYRRMVRLRKSLRRSLAVSY